MGMVNVHRYTRELKEAHGPKALAEAAQISVDFEKQRGTEQARMWLRAEAVLKEMQEPHLS